MNIQLIKRAFRQFPIQFVLSQTLQYQAQVLVMLLHRLRVNQNIINEYLDELDQVLAEHCVHQNHKYP